MDIGTDIKSSWKLDNGDLELVTDEDNIMQSIKNRISCWLNSMDLFYLEYGSIIPSFLGWKRNDETLGFMKIELENTLKQDPRLTNYDLDIGFNDDGGVDMHLLVHILDETVEMNLVISEEGSIVIADDVDEDDMEE